MAQSYTEDACLSELSECVGSFSCLAEPCHRAWSNIIGTSRVTFSMFNTARPDDLFADAYLTDIESLKSEKTAMKTQRPFTYKTSIIAAIYMSGEESLGQLQICYKMCDLFGDFFPKPSNCAKTVRKTIQRNPHVFFKEVAAKGVRYGVRSGIVSLYDTDDHLPIDDYLGLPHMLRDLQCGLRLVSRQYRKRKLEDVSGAPLSKRLSLEMPPRPRFLDCSGLSYDGLLSMVSDL